MNPAVTCLPVVIPTRRSVLQALLDRLRELADRRGALLRQPPRASPPALDLGRIRALEDLDEATLRDIGFAAWQIDQRAASLSRDVQRWLW